MRASKQENNMATILEPKATSSDPRCCICNKRVATRLCDFPIGTSRYIGHPPKSQLQEAKRLDVAWKKVEMKKTITCDKPLCDKCAIKINGNVDICPACKDKILKA